MSATTNPAKLTLVDLVRMYMDKRILVSITNSSNAVRVKETMQVPCEVIEVKVGFGNFRLKVTPVGGEGSIWVGLDRVHEIL